MKGSSNPESYAIPPRYEAPVMARPCSRRKMDMIVPWTSVGARIVIIESPMLRMA